MADQRKESKSRLLHQLQEDLRSVQEELKKEIKDSDTLSKIIFETVKPGFAKLNVTLEKDTAVVQSSLKKEVSSKRANENEINPENIAVSEQYESLKVLLNEKLEKFTETNKPSEGMSKVDVLSIIDSKLEDFRKESGLPQDLFKQLIDEKLNNFSANLQNLQNSAARDGSMVDKKIENAVSQLRIEIIQEVDKRLSELKEEVDAHKAEQDAKSQGPDDIEKISSDIIATGSVEDESAKLRSAIIAEVDARIAASLQSVSTKRSKSESGEAGDSSDSTPSIDVKGIRNAIEIDFVEKIKDMNDDFMTQLEETKEGLRKDTRASVDDALDEWSSKLKEEISNDISEKINTIEEEKEGNSVPAETATKAQDFSGILKSVNAVVTSKIDDFRDTLKDEINAIVDERIAGISVAKVEEAKAKPAKRDTGKAEAETKAEKVVAPPSLRSAPPRKKVKRKVKKKLMRRRATVSDVPNSTAKNSPGPAAPSKLRRKSSTAGTESSPPVKRIAGRRVRTVADHGGSAKTAYTPLAGEIDDIFKESDEIGWVVLHYAGAGKLTVKAKGVAGKIDEIKQHFSEDEYNLTYMRYLVGEERQFKLVLINWIGPRLKSIKRCSLLAQKDSIERFMKHFHVELTVNSITDISEDVVAEKLGVAAGASY